MKPACVQQALKRKDWRANPKALQAVNDEFDKLVADAINRDDVAFISVYDYVCHVLYPWLV